MLQAVFARYIQVTKWLFGLLPYLDSEQLVLNERMAEYVAGDVEALRGLSQLISSGYFLINIIVVDFFSLTTRNQIMPSTPNIQFPDDNSAQQKAAACLGNMSWHSER
jgi:hypothetical protein